MLASETDVTANLGWTMVNVVLTFAAMGGCILEGELLAIVISDSVGAGVVKNVELSEVSG